MDGDSQFSDVIRAARMVVSPNTSQDMIETQKIAETSRSSNLKVEGLVPRSTDTSFGSLLNLSFSQKTKEQIANGTFRLDGLDSQGLAAIEKAIPSSIVQEVASGPAFPVKAERVEMMETSPEKYQLLSNAAVNNQSFSAFPIFSKTCKTQGLTRTRPRTNNIFSQTNQTVENPVVVAKPVLDLATKGMNSPEFLEPEFKLPGSRDASFTHVFSSQDSDTVFSQVQIGSQNVTCLRKKTDMERMKKRMKPILADEMENDDDEECEEDEGFRDIPVPRPELSFEIFDGSKEESNIEADIQMQDLSLEKTEEEFVDSMEVTVMETSADYCFLNEQESSVLWTKQDKQISILLEWNTANTRKKIVRIKFMHYMAADSRENDVKIIRNDVKKCRKCIEKESGFPLEAYFYVTSEKNSGLDWKYYFGTSRGQFVQCEVPSHMNNLQFHLKFSCRESCMEIVDKRKKRCLIFYLEDENGNEILHRFIEYVHIIAAPRRDYYNFVNKRAGRAVPTPDFKPIFFPREMKPLQVSNTMRKRTVTDAGLDEMKNRENMDLMRRGYQERLMLGQAPREQNNHQIDDLFKHSNVKRSRPSASNVYSIQFIGERDRLEFFEFAKQKALKERYEAAQFTMSRAHPLTKQSMIAPTTTIVSWLQTMSLEHTEANFLHAGIFSMDHLIQRYEYDMQVFETVTLLPEERDVVFKTFLNFYHCWKADSLANLNH